jgi:gamma-glutamylaminecyclotransferase
MVAEDGEDERRANLIFTYGTLKRGFSNHALMQELMRTGDAALVGTYRTAEKFPLVCGPYRVPFLLNLPGCGQRVLGELYAVSFKGLVRMDELEGTTRGHYERLPIQLEPQPQPHEIHVDGDGDDDFANVTRAEAYYAHRSYAMEMWRKNGKKGLSGYTEREARGYVKRKDRPQNLSFLDHIRLFLSD